MHRNPIPFHCHSSRELRFPRGQSFVQALILLACSASALGQPNCAVSQSTYDTDLQYMKAGSPTHLYIMPTRYVELSRAARGLACSGVPLVAFDGLRYRLAGSSDDAGIYLLVPELARFIGISLRTAADVFTITTILLGSSFGLLGFLLTVRTSLGQRIGIVAFVLLSGVELGASDVYALGATAAVACVPWVMFFNTRKKITVSMLVTMSIVGLLAQTANLVRAHSGTGFLLCALLLVIGTYQVKLVARFLLVIIMLLGMAGPALLFRHFEHQRETFLQHQPRAVTELTRGHPLWHAIYLGLGYVKNSEVPAYKDEIAFAKVQQVRPGTVCCSPEYEQVLRSQTLDLARRRPLLILENVFVKLFVVLLICVLAGNVGLYAAILARKPICLEVAFWLAIGFYALPGILVVPNLRYFLGAIVFSALYAAYSVNFAEQNGQLHDRLRWLRRLVFVGPGEAGRVHQVSTTTKDQDNPQ